MQLQKFRCVNGLLLRVYLSCTLVFLHGWMNIWFNYNWMIPCFLCTAIKHDHICASLGIMKLIVNSNVSAIEKITWRPTQHTLQNPAFLYVYSVYTDACKYALILPPLPLPPPPPSHADHAEFGLHPDVGIELISSFWPPKSMNSHWNKLAEYLIKWWRSCERWFAMQQTSYHYRPDLNSLFICNFDLNWRAAKDMMENSLMCMSFLSFSLHPAPSFRILFTETWNALCL